MRRPSVESALQKNAKLGAWREVVEIFEKLETETLNQEVAEWAAAFQDSPYPLALIGLALQSYAWDARGSGWASTVSESDWELFRVRMDDAAHVIAVARELGPGNPAVSLAALQVAMGEGKRTTAERESMFNDVVKAVPDNRTAHWAIHEQKMQKWYGSDQEALAFVAESAAQRGVFLPVSSGECTIPGADEQFRLVWGKLRGTGYNRDRLLSIFCGCGFSDKPPSVLATNLLATIATVAHVEEAGQWAKRLAAETWLLPTQPPKLFGSTPFRQVLADSNTHNLCDCCWREIMPGETWWRDLTVNVDVCEACLAVARRFDSSSITLDMRQPSYKPSAASRASRPKSRRELAQDEVPVAALAVAVVVPHDDREYGGGPPSEAMRQRELVDDGRYLVRWEDKSIAEIRVSNGAFTCQGSNYKLKPGVKPATIVWPDGTSQVLKDVMSRPSAARSRSPGPPPRARLSGGPTWGARYGTGARGEETSR